MKDTLYELRSIVNRPVAGTAAGIAGFLLIAALAGWLLMPRDEASSATSPITGGLVSQSATFESTNLT